MKDSYLIQRLKKPFKSENKLTEISNAFAFGGGYVNGGIPEDGMKLLREIFRFDYMGAAEFEFGAVPEALSLMGKNFENLIGFKMMVPFLYETWSKKKKLIKGIKPVYVICFKEHRADVCDRILKWAKSNYPKDVFTKETVNLNSSLAAEQLLKEDADRYSTEETVGWLELDNGYFFFTDRDMWTKTAELFDVKSEDEK